LAAGGVARSLQIHADVRLARALPAVKIPAPKLLKLFLRESYGQPVANPLERHRGLPAQAARQGNFRRIALGIRAKITSGNGA